MIYPRWLQRLKEKSERLKIPARLVFIILGIASTVWFLLRVIPKPSRAGYPCVRAAAPFMSGFVLYLLALGTSVFAFRKFREKMLQAKYLLAGLFLAMSIVASVTYLIKDTQAAKAATPPDGVNNPMGTAQGIKPGRVVWAWDSAATNAFTKNKLDLIDGSTFDTNFYFSPKNNDQAVINQMVSDAIMKLADKPTEEEAWDAIFHYFNNKKHGEDSGYKSGQVVFIKVNSGSMSWSGKFDAFTLERNLFSEPDIVETTPFTMYAVLKSLTEKAKVPQNKIVIGEPIRNLYKDVYEYIRKDFKDISILGNDLQNMFNSLDLITLGRSPVAIGNDTVYYSDGTPKDNLYDIYSYCDYLINIAALKGHYCNGVTLCAKNHFGSQANMSGGTASAQHLHPSLIAPNNNKKPPVASKVINGSYKKYRVMVDMMGHPKLGGNTLLYMVDGLYSGQDGYFAPSIKWRKAPFDTNYPSSVFVSLDPVAIESVCLDFLRNEYDDYDAANGHFDCPNYPGVDDYLHQAADKANWPASFSYKPDGKNEIGSLGTHEHWNNVNAKKYSRNLDPVNGKGIELVGVMKANLALGMEKNMTETATIGSIYPNPAVNTVNIDFTIAEQSDVKITIVNIQGQSIATILNETRTAGQYSINWNFNEPSGVYVCRMEVKNRQGTKVITGKIQVMK